MTKTIRAIKIDALARTVEEIRLPVEPGNPEAGYGEQVIIEEFQKRLGCDHVEMLGLDYGNMMIVDGEALLNDDGQPRMFLQWGENGQPIADGAIICGHITSTDTWCDTMITVEEVKETVILTLRKVRGTKVTKPQPGHISIELVAPIIEEK